MISELRKELMIINGMDYQPNYSELGRKYGLDPRTVKKHHKGYRGRPPTRRKKSLWDEYYTEIKEKLHIPGMTIKGLFKFMESRHGNVGKYGNFRRYVKKNELVPIRAVTPPTPRFETPFGRQLQFDWKEEVKLSSRNGEVFVFNIFTAVLSASRVKVFVYSRYKTRDDVIRCLISVFEQLGGVPDEALTDAMSSIVNTRSLKFVPEFLQFCKDMGIKPKRCKVKSPQTKGKCESSNRFLRWLLAYNYEFDTEEDIIGILAQVNKQVNQEVNSTTGVTPLVLYAKEKEHLNPLPNRKILDSYLAVGKQVTVESDCLVYYRGSRYSVSPKYIGKKVIINEVDNELQIHYNNKLITTHELGTKTINYQPNHYLQMHKELAPYRSDEELQALAKENLQIFDELCLPQKGEI